MRAAANFGLTRYDRAIEWARRDDRDSPFEENTKGMSSVVA